MLDAPADVDALPVLVAEAQRGNRWAADWLVREHEGWVRTVVYAVVGRWDQVDDIVQQVWALVWMRLPSLKDPQRLRSWLCSVARNAALDAGQTRRRHAAQQMMEPVADSLADKNGRVPVRAMLDGELRTMLLRAVEALPVHYREPFVLRHLEDWSYQQIGEMLGLAVKTVEKRLVRARRLLREMLKDVIEP